MLGLPGQAKALSRQLLERVVYPDKGGDDQVLGVKIAEGLLAILSRSLLIAAPLLLKLAVRLSSKRRYQPPVSSVPDASRLCNERTILSWTNSVSL